MSLFPLLAVVADRSDLADALTRRGCVPTPAPAADVLVVEAVNGAVSTIKSNWGGTDAEQFQSDWHGQRQVVSAAGDKLDAMGKKCKTNAESQKQTSSK